MKKFLALILGLCLTISCFSVFVLAADPEAKIGETNYNTLADAIEALNADTGSDEKTLTLLKDVALNGAQYTLKRSKVTLDGENHTVALTATAAGSFLTVSGSDVTVKNLTVENKSSAFVGGIAHTGTGVSGFENVKVVYPQDAKYVVTSAAFYIVGNASAKLELTIRNCSATTGKNRFFTVEGGAQKVEVTLIDNNFVNPADYGRCADIKGEGSKVLVKSGYYQTNSTAVFRVWGGELTIEDGTFHLKGNGDTILAAEKYDAASGGLANIKSGVFLSGNTQASKKAVIYSGPGTVNVTSGIFIATKSLATGYAAVVNKDNTDLAFESGSLIAIKGDKPAPTMDNGAAAILEKDMNGMVFTSRMNAATVKKLEMLKAALTYVETTDAPLTVTYGTLIVPASTLVAVGGGKVPFTHNGILTTLDPVYYDVKAGEASFMTDETGNVTYRAGISGLSGDDYATGYCAIAYVQISAGKVNFTLYSEFSEENNKRSLSGIAASALADDAAGLTGDDKLKLAEYVRN